MKINKTDLAYMAGVFDGEGTISLHMTRSSTGQPNRYPRMAVVNTDINLVLPFKQFFGGHINTRKGLYVTKNATRHKPIHVWYLDTDKELLRSIKQLLPFIRETEKLRRINLLLNKYMPRRQKGIKRTKEEKNSIKKLEKEFFKNSLRATLYL